MVVVKVASPLSAESLATVENEIVKFVAALFEQRAL